ncbi:MAG: hypothetical protein J0H88_08360 [Sphingomonadales bacterium]|nr:hypothetical protein [Sphingomonadales bacterium]
MPAFLHTETGSVHIVADPDEYGAPDWEALPDPPEGAGPWRWVGEAWERDAAPVLAALRTERNARLAASDYPPLFERPESEQPAWRTYRQALRDMPETADPFAPEWPEPPGA